MADEDSDRTWQELFDDIQENLLPKSREDETVPDEAVEFFDELLDEDRDPERANEKFDEWMGDDED